MLRKKVLISLYSLGMRSDYEGERVDYLSACAQRGWRGLTLVLFVSLSCRIVIASSNVAARSHSTMTIKPQANSSSKRGHSKIKKITFSKRIIKVGSHVIAVEVAEKFEQWERGLMYRAQLSKNEGMLFIYPEARVLNFWMKNTLIPLSVAFFDENKKLIHIENMEPDPSMRAEKALKPKKSTKLKTERTENSSSAEGGRLKIYSSERAAKYALEMNKGWFSTNHVTTGTELLFFGENNP